MRSNDTDAFFRLAFQVQRTSVFLCARQRRKYDSFLHSFCGRIPLQNKEQLKEAVNDTNKNVKYTKALLSGKDEAKVSLDYGHKITDKESTKNIVPHIIKTLDFAVGYLEKRVREN